MLRKILQVMESFGESIKIMMQMKSLSHRLFMINSLFKSLVSFRECCIQLQTQGERSEEAVKQNSIFKLSSIKKIVKRF